VAQRVGRGIALLFHDRGTRRESVVSSAPRPHFTPGKDPVPILQEAGWTPGPVWTGGKCRPHWDFLFFFCKTASLLVLIRYRVNRLTHCSLLVSLYHALHSAAASLGESLRGLGGVCYQMMCGGILISFVSDCNESGADGGGVL